MDLQHRSALVLSSLGQSLEAMGVFYDRQSNRVPTMFRDLTARLLGEHLGVHRAFYGAVEGDEWVIAGDYEHGIVPLTPGRDTAATYGDWMMQTYRQGGVLNFSDSQTDPRFSAAERATLAHFQITAALGVGLVKGGQLDAIFAVHSATPRDWTAEEVSLVTETAERTWGAVARVQAEAARGAAEQALRKSETRFRQFADAASGVLWIRRADTLQFEYVSPAFEALYGDSFERVFAGNNLRNWVTLILPEDRRAVLHNFRRVRRGERMTHEFRIRRPRDGTIRWIRNTDFPLRDEQGRVQHIAGIGEDITAAKQAELSLHELNAELERHVEKRTDALMAAEAMLRQVQKMDAVGQLASGIAHDFNNMLQGIAGSLELTRRRSDQGRLMDAARHVDNARDTVQRAATLTHRLLAFSRQQTLDPTPVHLDALVAGMTEMIRRTVGSAVQVEVRLGDGAWLALCDASQLENALLNLCVNARDAMPEGGWLTILTEEVELSVADLLGEADVVPGAYVGVSVSDTGIGMSPEVVARVFEPFFTTKPLGQGTGLGLAQVYGFVRQSSGLVRLESAVGQGTTVRLLLPRYVATGETPDDQRASDVVLLVEDEADLRAMAAEWLHEAGYRVLEASDGASALRLIQGGGRVDILVTDIGLPGGMNGRQVGDAARAQRPGLPVLFISGRAATALRAALPEGAAMIDKPFALDELAARVQTMLKAAETLIGVSRR